MSEPHAANRRQFFKQAAMGAGALSAVAGTAGMASVAGAEEAPASPARRKTKIRIGCRFDDRWLHSAGDVDLQFFKQIGVDYADINLHVVPGYLEHGIFTKQALRSTIERLRAVGLKIERANTRAIHYMNAHLNRPEGQKEIDNLKRIGEMLADAEIPVFGVQACNANLHVDTSRAGWTTTQGRGGYTYHSFDVARSRAEAPKAKYSVTSDQLWKGLLNIYRQVMPTVEGSKTVIAMHGNDPPLYQHLGLPQIICRFADFDRLFDEVPSQHSGITFCVGTRYESGEDVLAGIRHFAERGKLFHVHFRNVKETLPVQKGYSEVAVDEGDMDMAQVLQTLNEVGYEGVIDYDHPMHIVGDEPLPKQYIAFAVGYMRGLLQSL